MLLKAAHGRRPPRPRASWPSGQVVGRDRRPADLRRADRPHHARGRRGAAPAGRGGWRGRRGRGGRRRPGAGRPRPRGGRPGRVARRHERAPGATASAMLAGMAEQERGAGPLPPVERVRPGCGAFRCRSRTTRSATSSSTPSRRTRGPYLIDAGWNTDDAYQTLVAGLDQAGFAIGDVQGVHGDPHPPRPLRSGRAHPGGVGRLGRASTRPTPRLIDARYEEPERPARARWPPCCAGTAPRRRR